MPSTHLGPVRGHRAGRRSVGAGLLAALAVLLLTIPRPEAQSDAHGFDKAEVRAMLFAREEAAESGEPLVLLGWFTHFDAKGNGRRSIAEHQVWYVGDPSHPYVQELSPVRILLDTEVESFGLRSCRIYRGDDTLFVQGNEWTRETPRGWPERAGVPWAEVVGELPELQAGDVLEVAYDLDNEWTQFFLPSDWATIPITSPLARTIERRILVSYPSAIEGHVKVAGHGAKLVRHYGVAVPLYELHTGYLPAGPANATGLDAPRLYFTASSSWDNVRRECGFLYDRARQDGEQFFRVIGDSITEAVGGGSRSRLDAAMRYLDDRLVRVPRNLTSSRYYPRDIRAVTYLGGADPVEWGLLLTALASSAHLSVDLFLARSDTTGFLPNLYTAGQFDQIALRVLIIEDDKQIWVDAQAPTLADGLERAKSFQWVVATGGKQEALLRRNADGAFEPYVYSDSGQD